MGMIFWVVLAVIVVYGVMLFNSLVNIKNNVSKAWANIDVLLKQRHDELPKLIDTCKQYMKHEQDTLAGRERAGKGHGRIGFRPECEACKLKADGTL